MRAPVSWLRELVDLPQGTTTEQIAERWTDAGLNVERIERIGDLTGPIVVGRVLTCEREPQKNGKVVSWCTVDVGPEHNGPDGHRGIVCGAPNVDAGKLVVVSLPGAVLPGGFAIAARKTYGHLSDGMICAVDELGLGTDHEGIIELPEVVDGREVVPGLEALDLLQGRDEVLDADITPDTGYCLSLRGLARETAQAFGVAFTDPYQPTAVEQSQGSQAVRVEDPTGCSLFTATTITGIDPAAATPTWMARRLELAGMRSISVAVDVTNYVMLESGQPLHAYDADALSGAIVVRRAHAGEQLTTLDGVSRTLRPDDLLIADDSGPIGLAGVMGGATTEMTSATRNVVLEAAHFESVTIARAFRHHKLPSEASRRFERGVDPALAPAAARRAAELLAELAGGTVQPHVTVVGDVAPMPDLQLDPTLPARVLGTEVATERVAEILTASGCTLEVSGAGLHVTPPTWRNDLVDPYDYVEEVGRKIGFGSIQGIVPKAPAGRGLTPAQQARRAVLAAVAQTGFVELVSLPFIGQDELDRMGLPVDDVRRRAVQLANPLADTQPLLRTSLLPGLFAAVARNTSRSQDDLSLFECGTVFRSRDDQPAAPMPPVDRRPTEQEYAAIDAALADQPRLLAGVVTGDWLSAGWQGPAVRADWTHAVLLAQSAAEALGVRLERRAGQLAPWHPGRCAELLVDGRVMGAAGELHPSVVKAFGLPARACAVELDLDALIAAAPGPGTIEPLSSFPLAHQDVALVVDEQVDQASVLAALVEGAGDLLESCELFDIYRGPQIGEGKKSLAFALHFRGPDRTLTDTEAAQARDAAVRLAAERCGAAQRA